MTMAQATLATRMLTIALPGNRILLVALAIDEHGSPLDLCIGAGYATDPALKVLAEGVNLPASALPELRDALTALDEART
jgi:hypothetical protein